MKKSDLILKLAEKNNLTENNATRVVDLVFEGFTDTLKDGNKIEIRGFGSFHVREYGAYTGRNPRNGEHVEVKPKRAPFFKVGRGLKKMVDGK